MSSIVPCGMRKCQGRRGCICPKRPIKTGVPAGVRLASLEPLPIPTSSVQMKAVATKPVKPAPAANGSVAATCKPERGGKGLKSNRNIRPGRGKPAASRISPAKGKGKMKKAKKGVTSTPDPKQVAAAILIQRTWKIYVVRKRAAAKRAADKLRREQQEEMDRQEAAAYAEMVKQQLKADQKRAAQEAEKRRKEAEKRKREAELREAAFDGEVDEIRRLLDLGPELCAVDAKDANDETALLEAAGGGSVDAIDLLVERGADVNAQGKYSRSTLYRAAFAGHHKAARRLLELGADPRLHDNEGQPPVEIAATAQCKKVLEDWDIAKTEKLLVVLEEKRTAMLEVAQAKRQAEAEKVRGRFEEIKQKKKIKAREFAKARVAYERRLFEADFTHTTEKKEQKVLDTVLTALKQAEAHLKKCKEESAAAEAKFQEIKIQMREQEAKDQAIEGTLPAHRRCGLRELEDVVVRDSDGAIAGSGKVPFLIDLSKQADAFFRYRDVNYISAASPKDMEPDSLRIALLGALRYGKPIVVDLLDVDLWDQVKEKLEAIRPGLLEVVLTRQISNPEHYEPLIRESDGEQYRPIYFQAERIANFEFIFLTTLRFPEPEMLEACYPIEVVPMPVSGGA